MSDNDSDDDDNCGLVTFTLSSVSPIVRDDEIVEVVDDDDVSAIREFSNGHKIFSSSSRGFVICFCLLTVWAFKI